MRTWREGLRKGEEKKDKNPVEPNDNYVRLYFKSRRTGRAWAENYLTYRVTYLTLRYIVLFYTSVAK